MLLSIIEIIAAGAVEIALLIFVHHVKFAGAVAHLQLAADVASQRSESIGGVHGSARNLLVIILHYHEVHFAERLSGLVVRRIDIASGSVLAYCAGDGVALIIIVPVGLAVEAVDVVAAVIHWRQAETDGVRHIVTARRILHLRLPGDFLFLK